MAGFDSMNGVERGEMGDFSRGRRERVDPFDPERISRRVRGRGAVWGPNRKTRPRACAELRVRLGSVALARPG